MLDTGLASTSLRTLTERLRELAQGTQSLVLRGSPGGAAPQPPPLTLLAHVVELLGAAKGLFSWLNRYLFSTLNDFSASRDIVVLCAQLVETLQEVGARGGHAALRPRLWESPPTSPDTPTLPADPLGSPPPLPTALLGLEITSTSSRLHFVSATPSEGLAAHGGLILPGDEIVQVNEQVVVGWTRDNLEKKLLEKAGEVTLVLKKIPLDSPDSPPSPRQQLPGAFSDAADSPGARSSECPGSPVSLSSSAAADLDSGPDSAPDPATEEEEGEDERHPRLRGADVGQLPGLPGCGVEEEGAAWEGGTSLGTPPDTPPDTPTSLSNPLDTPSAPSTRLGTPSSPGTLAAAGPCTAELSPTSAPTAGAGGAEPSELTGEGSPQRGRRPKGVATRLSRRRVSCRDLGRVDCDGWLLKKKDHVGFMAQKWKRCWFVLKGHTLYWYHHPNDEKAVGLINVATYDLESTREQKKKYVFQLSHQRYKPFVFAAETLADLSMWVSHLVTAKMKYTLAHQSVPDREEDCYSETEAEDPDDESPRHGCDSPRKKPPNAPEKAQLFAAGEPSSAASSPQGSPRPGSPMDSAGEDLECLMQCLKQGGVSLIGRQRFLTQEQCRKSFIRRNKNPHINEKVHTVRALQSTLKAKLEELHALEQLLSDATLTSEKFTRWKDEHQELYQELRECWAGQGGQDSDGGLGAEQGLPKEAAAP
ncbi:connector enhancer of kinase suppressor of ras 1 isoform A [Patagioenas fasciata monilis]|uniref:Connector enhancer of kinase suppressor of ras 1 isoform A n=1 Tax=Patagioenas fasciata monilis TaxID=372326 RepID=A0A1V4JDG2_PATFA|nr:connector enhancer of kinase suppressor of ras 1 isoform A [Patagioenas fasciata monilis]